MHPLREWLSQPGRSQQALAARMGVSQGLISQHLNWLEGKDKNATRVSGERALAYERATEGAVPKHLIRPDLFGAAGSMAACVFGAPPERSEAA